MARNVFFHASSLAEGLNSELKVCIVLRVNFPDRMFQIP